jgi:hypothetical protein
MARSKRLKWDTVPTLSPELVNHIFEFLHIPGLKVWAHCGHTTFTQAYQRMATFSTEVMAPHLVVCQRNQFRQSSSVLPIHVHAMVHRVCAICNGSWQGPLQQPWLIPAHHECFQELLVPVSARNDLPGNLVRHSIPVGHGGVIARPHRAVVPHHTLARFEQDHHDSIEVYRRQREAERYEQHSAHRQHLQQARAARAAAKVARDARRNDFLAGLETVATWAEAGAQIPDYILSDVDRDTGDDVPRAIQRAQQFMVTSALIPSSLWGAPFSHFISVTDTQETIDALVDNPHLHDILFGVVRSDLHRAPVLPVLRATLVENIKTILEVLPADTLVPMYKKVMVAAKSTWSPQTRARLATYGDSISKALWWHAVSNGPADDTGLLALMDSFANASPQIVQDLVWRPQLEISARLVEELGFMNTLLPSARDSKVRFNAALQPRLMELLHEIRISGLTRPSEECMRLLACDISFAAQYVNACSASCGDPFRVWGRECIKSLPFYEFRIAAIGAHLASFVQH